MIKKITKLKLWIGLIILVMLAMITPGFAQSPPLPIAEELVFPIENDLYIPGSYSNRYFSCCATSRVGRHLGEDMYLDDGYPIQAIGDGKIVVYRPANGYGKLVVVIEHDLGQEYTFTNGYGQPVTTRYILSIYGHLRKNKWRGDSTNLPWRAEQYVDKGDVIAYVDSPPTNGDGGRHLHMGIRLSSLAVAISRDPSAWFRGYERTTTFGEDFGSALEVIQMLGGGYVPPNDNPPPDPGPVPGPGPGPGPAPGPGSTPLAPGEHSFGGMVTNVYNCSCTGNHLLTIDNLSTEGPRPVTLLYQPGASVVYENNKIPQSGVWLNGVWENRGDSCVNHVAVSCGEDGLSTCYVCSGWHQSDGTITFTGTSN